MERDDIDFPNLRLDPINRIRSGHWKIPFPIGHQVTLDRALIDCSMSRGSWRTHAHTPLGYLIFQLTRIQLNHSLMDIRDIIKPDITGLPKRAKFRPKLIPNIYSKHPNPLLPVYRTIQPSQIWVQIYPSNPPSSCKHPTPSTSPSLIFEIVPPPSFPPLLPLNRCTLDRQIHAFCLLPSAITNSRGSWERKREAKEVLEGGWRRKEEEDGHRPLKPASICRDRKLDDRNLIVAFRTSSHRIGNILCCSCRLLSDKKGCVQRKGGR